MIRLGILGSTRGTNLLPLIEAIEQQRLPASIEVVISNKEDALILSKAKTHGLKTTYLPVNGLSREAYDEQINKVLKSNEVNCVVLIGYMRILSHAFVSSWPKKMINIHPSLLPAHAGIMDLQVHEAVLKAQETQTGCTVHYVTEEVDAGPILLQKTCPVDPEDSPESLKVKVQKLEAPALIEAIHMIERAMNKPKPGFRFAPPRVG